MAICGLNNDQTKTLFNRTTALGALSTVTALVLERYLPRYGPYFRRGAKAAAGITLASYIGRITIAEGCCDAPVQWTEPDDPQEFLSQARTILADQELNLPEGASAWRSLHNRLQAEQSKIMQEFMDRRTGYRGRNQQTTLLQLGLLMNCAQAQIMTLTQTADINEVLEWLKGDEPPEALKNV